MIFTTRNKSNFNPVKCDLIKSVFFLSECSHEETKEKDLISNMSEEEREINKKKSRTQNFGELTGGDGVKLKVHIFPELGQK